LIPCPFISPMLLKEFSHQLHLYLSHVVLLLLLLRNPQNQTEYDYEKLNLTIMVTC